MNRLMIFSHSDPHDGVSAHVLFTLERMRPLFEKMVFVSASMMTQEDTGQVCRFCDKIIIREACRTDFDAWKTAIAEEGWEHLKSFDHLTLMNSSCFGPIFDLLPLFEQMELPGVDFWGLTECSSSGFRKPGNAGAGRRHLQSHFICFSKKVVISATFMGFWEKLDIRPGIKNHDAKYGSSLTRVLVRSGFQYNVLFREKPARNQNKKDFTVWHPDILIRQGVPFVKIKGFLKFQHPKYLKLLMERHSDYPFPLIDEYISKTYPPNISLKALDKNLVTKPGEAASTVKSRVAVHVHVYYVDVFEKIIHRLEKTGLIFDLFITTGSQAKKEQILEFIHAKQLHHQVQEIFIYENRGRDLFPWLDVAEKLGNYDIAGHFHTKKSSWTDEWIGDSWMENIISTLIDPAGEIMDLFHDRPDIGIVIPDIPYCHKLIPEVNTWSKNKAIFNTIWKKLKLNKRLDISELSFPIMAYGNMFWYRPVSLKPLVDMHIALDEFPPEPLPPDDTIAHAIERLPVYIAWCQGYDFRIALDSHAAYSGFDFKAANERLHRVYQSLTWKICSGITSFPGKMLFRLKST